jgi:hypothetical protein
MSVLQTLVRMKGRVTKMLVNTGASVKMVTQEVNVKEVIIENLKLWSHT